MGRIRSFFKRAAKPLVMVMVAMSLSVSLVVTTPSNAQATTVVAARLAIPPLLLGSGAMPIGAALRLVAPFAGPLGWTFLGVTTVAAGLVATQDYWLPYLDGTFGEAKGPKPSTESPTGTRTYPGAMVNSLQQVNTNVWQVNISTGPLTNDTNWVGYTAKLSCKNRSNGVITQRGYEEKVAWGKTATGANVYSQFYCRTGVNSGIATNEDIVGGTFGSFGAAENLAPSCFAAGNTTPACYWPGVANIWRWGDHLAGGTPAFDPASPETTYKTTVECIRADGTKFELTAESPGDMKAVKVPSCEAAVPGSHATGKTIVEGFPPGVETPERLYESPAIGSDPDYPLCGVNRPGPLCKLAVQIDQKECVVGLWDCVNWSELSKDPNHAPRVSCQYGPYSVATDKCNPLERAYEEGGAPATEPNVDGNPGTRSDTDPSGNQIPKQQPQNGTVPGGAGKPQVGAAPGSPEANKAECWPNGWGIFAPDWFLTAMKCAFEPSPNVEAKVQNMNQSFSNKAPFVWVAGAGAVVAGSANVSGSCPDWTINVQGLSKNVVCESSFTQAILNSRGALFGLMVIAMFWPLIRAIWYSVIPILRPAPTS
jgi:hypothetical protein